MTARQRWVVALLTVAPLLLVAFKASGLPGSASLAGLLSLEGLPHAVQARAHHLLFTPLGAWLVVFTRLTLGVRVLGPFRSVLLAIAFQVTGPVVGVVFFALVLASVVLLRPVVKGLRLAYFGRSAVMLTAVAVLITAGMLAGLAAGAPGVERVAFFPVVVLTLAGDAFSTTLRREGARSALWRASATAAVALVLTGLAGVVWVQGALVRHPELMLTVLGGTVLTADLAAWRLLQHLNPPVKKRKPRKPRPNPGAG
jgi:hypothetical protein